MTEPDTTTQTDEVDDSSEQTLSTENSMHAQVKPLIWYWLLYNEAALTVHLLHIAKEHILGASI